MNATRILPDLQCSLLCEEIRQEVTGNFFLIGVMNYIRVPQVPVVALRLSLFNRWTAGIGNFTETVRLIAPDQTTVLRKGEVKFGLKDPTLNATNVTFFGQVEFKVAGTYYVEVLVDDVMKLRYPVPLVVAPPQNQPQTPQGAQPGCTVNVGAGSDKSDKSDESDRPNRVQPTPPSAAGPKRPFAWQPLTPKGVAAFAGATFGRVLTVQFVFALLAASMVVWFFSRDWVPVITQAISQMPEQGEIRSGRLSWNGDSPVSLAENRFFALSIDLKHEGQVRSPAHVAVELGERDFKIYSLLGYVQGHYPQAWWMGLNRTDATPWWGAWAPPILGIVAVLVIINLLLTWAILATVYAGPAWLMGFFANRDLGLGASWRLCGAALMPGCVLMIGAIFIYGLGLLDLVRLGVAVAGHFVVSWVYIWLSIRKLALHPESAVTKVNPFTSSASAEKKRD